jgi:serine/threonine-protein kinase RsbW
LLELDGWMPSEIGFISPMVEQLMRLIEAWRCVAGNEFAVELALRKALNNAVVHGNAMDPNKSVEVRCRCERGKGLWLTVKDQGNGFDPTAVPNPLGSERLRAEHGRGIHLMKLMMDEVSFHCAGSEVQMRKGPARHAPAELPTSNTSETRTPRKDKEKQDAIQSCGREQQTRGDHCCVH